MHEKLGAYRNRQTGNGTCCILHILLMPKLVPWACRLHQVALLQQHWAQYTEVYLSHMFSTSLADIARPACIFILF